MQKHKSFDLGSNLIPLVYFYIIDNNSYKEGGSFCGDKCNHASQKAMFITQFIH